MGSMERSLRRRQEQAAPKPAAGAVDLEQFKGGDRQEQQKIADRMLAQGGWLCSCGNRFRDEAIVAVGYNLGRFPVQVMTPQGPRMMLDDGAQMLNQTFCSKRCLHYHDALENGIAWPEGSQPGMPRPKIVAVRLLPPVEWLDEEPGGPLPGLPGGSALVMKP